ASPCASRRNSPQAVLVPPPVVAGRSPQKTCKQVRVLDALPPLIGAGLVGCMRNPFLRWRKEVSSEEEEIVEQIAKLNDLCRTAMGVGGRLVQTAGISALPPQIQSAIREKVERFRDFTPDNDPHGERDFGTFNVDGVREKIFWKID